MLKQRLITAAILIPLIIWVLLATSTQVLVGIMSIFVLIGAWEWAALCGWQTKLTRSFYVALVGLILLASYWFQHYIIYSLIIAGVWWLVALYWTWQYQQQHDLLPTNPMVKALLGIVILVPAWIALLLLREHYSGQWVLFLFVLIWAADSGAYFAGKKWGKTKLADKVSPGKTLEGVSGALFMGLAIALGYALFQSISLLFILLCLLTILVSILGDLLESMFKRQMGIKDSGNILPGHGGVLDRIDSLTSAAPIFVGGLILFF
ncbi:phosphatidate cytidylyltransferase [Candidatus Halobeggiatoa sp. HSG11]|nr:phosphatidate cytidylyltransferase [Candidatus Halobeggiatoa sp. HSG11]